MEIIRPLFEVLCMTDHPELPYQYSKDPRLLIEAAGRICYKSSDAITKDSADKFVEARKKEGHLTMMEHSWQARGYVWTTTSFTPAMGNWSKYLYISDRVFRDSNDKGNMYLVICGNTRAFEEAEKEQPWLLENPFIFLSEKELYKHATEGATNEPQLLRASVRLINDRGVSHETVRHRPPAICQESTRYVNYLKKGAQFLLPPWVDRRNFHWKSLFNKAKRADLIWLFACWLSEKLYNALLKHGWVPQKARSVLINSLKTEMVVTATFAEWQHIFRQRALGLTGKPHPQMEELMIPLQKEFAHMEPFFFSDWVLRSSLKNESGD